MILVNSAGCTCLRVGCNRTYLLEGKFLSCVRGSLRDHSGHYQSTWVVSPNPQPSQENASGSCHAAIRVGMPDERIFAILGLPKLEKEMATHSSILAWRIPGMAEPGGLPSMRSHRVGHDWSDLAAAAASCQQGKNLIALKSQKSIKSLMFLSLCLLSHYVDRIFFFLEAVIKAGGEVGLEVRLLSRKVSAGFQWHIIICW